MDRLAICAAAALLIASGAGCPSTNREAPASLSVTEGPTFDVVDLHWLPPTVAFDAYELQVRTERNDWRTRKMRNSLYPGQAEFAFDAGSPELARFFFRLRSLRGGSASAWSNEVGYLRGVRPSPRVFAVVSPGVAVSLSWDAGSDQAQEIVVERQVVTADGAAGPWLERTRLPASALDYTDSDLGAWVDAARLSYQIEYVKNGVKSKPAAATTDQAPLLAPAELRSAPAGRLDIRIDWIARSRYADRQIVSRMQRAGGADLAVLARDATSFTDTVPREGIYYYWVTARLGDLPNPATDSSSEPVLAFTEVAPTLPFSVSRVHMPAASQAVRDSAGRFGLARVAGPTGYELHAMRPAASGWTDHLIAGQQQLLQPGVLFDGQDRMHVLYRAPSPASPTLHEWYDGTAWQQETPGLAFADASLDGSGALHAVGCAGDVASVTYATNRSGSWVKQEIATSNKPAECRIAVSDAGDPKIVYAYLPPLGGYISAREELVLVAPSGQSWAEEAVPLAPDGKATFGSFLHVFTGPARTTVLFDSVNGGNIPAAEIHAVDREANGWTIPAIVGKRLAGSAVAAAAPGASRLAVAWNGTDYTGRGSPTTVAVRDPHGTWTSIALFQSSSEMAVGFTREGTLWVLDGLGQFWPQPSDFLLYVER